MSAESKQNSIPKPLNDLARNKLIHQLLKQMDQVQWWAPIKIANNQLEELKKLMTYAKQHSPFYQQRLQDFDIENLDFEKYQKLAVLSRNDLREYADSIDCDPVPSAHGKIESMMTSGSTGSPVEIRATGITYAIWCAINLRDHIWHKRDVSLDLAAIRWRVENIGMPPDGLIMDDWGDPYDQFYKTGRGLYLNSSSNVVDQVDWLHRNDPHYLITHPSNLQSIILEMHNRGLELKNLREVRTVAEALPQGLAADLDEVLNAKLVDCYSSQEVGYIALQCPEFNHYHVQSESLMVEVVDEDGNPCKPGETGKVLVTNLRNYATPTLRYDIGDYAVVGESCPCGRGLPVLERINGRVRNMLHLPDGNQRWPNLGFREIMKIADIRQFQLVQHELDRIELKLSVNKPVTTEQEVQIKNILVRFLAYPFEIEISYHDELPRGANGKYEDFVSAIGVSS